MKILAYFRKKTLKFYKWQYYFVGIIYISLMLCQITPVLAVEDDNLSDTQSNNGLSFIAISHIHRTLSEPSSDVFERAIAKINDLEPNFVMFLGDYIRGYDNFIKDWEKFNNIADKIEVERFMIAGNHEIVDSPNDKLVSDLTKLEYYQKNVGDLYYSFSKNNNLFIALNGVNLFNGVMIDSIDSVQLDFLKKELEEISQYQNVFIFTSQCSWLTSDNNWYSDVVPIIEDRVDYVMCGDVNNPYYTEIGGIIYVMGGMGTHSQVYNKNFFIRVNITSDRQVKMFPVLIDDGNFLELPDFYFDEIIDYDSARYNYSRFWDWIKDHSKLIVIGVAVVTFLFGLFVGKKIKRN